MSENRSFCPTQDKQRESTASNRRADGQHTQPARFWPIVVALAYMEILSCNETAIGKPIVIEVLNTVLDTSNVGTLKELACRNMNRIVHLELAVRWLETESNIEADGLVFWTPTGPVGTEFLFGQNDYSVRHGDYLITGYFVPTAGGTHQGVSSISFKRVDDKQISRTPNIVEIKAKQGCKATFWVPPN